MTDSQQNLPFEAAAQARPARNQTPARSAGRKRPKSASRRTRSPLRESPTAKPARSKGASGGRVTAETMATRQREISVSEFFAKNRHLLGFDNPSKALLTTIKELVDNALDASSRRIGSGSAAPTTGPGSSADTCRSCSGSCFSAPSSTASR
jgi:hypothetical protein